MPHINRIRVNNVKYNFGTQFYDDFVMRFDGRNALYDLANGGGKSVLMLLLFQNLIPNCTLDDKQPIEKLFRTSDGSTTIHSLVEWTLDEAQTRDDYKYMLTGFCARRARDDADETKSRDAASIDYFNYVIFYREYNDNDIINLPLKRGSERITYGGLRSYIKELGHNDYNLSVHIFDRKGEYQRFISRYGLYESAWEIVRGINKTEGHVRTYFETNYKTTRKVIEDLLIEEIIQKAFLMRAGEGKPGGGLGNGKPERGAANAGAGAGSAKGSGVRDGGSVDVDMARTLLDIKDKLLELSKKKEEISGYDKQAEVLESFAGRIDTLNQLYTREQAFRLELVKTYNTAANSSRQKEKELALAEKEKEKSGSRIGDITKKLETIKIQESRERLKACEADAGKFEAEIEDLRSERREKQAELNLKQSMNDYLEYAGYKKKADTVRQAMAHVNGGHDGLAHRLNVYAARQKLIFDKNLRSWNSELIDLRRQVRDLSVSLEISEQSCLELDKSLAVTVSELDREQGVKAQLARELSALRQTLNSLLLEGSGRELRRNRTDQKAAREALEAHRTRLADADTRLRQYSVRRESIRVSLENLAADDERLSQFFREYDSKKVKADKLMEIYHASDYRELKSIIYERYRRVILELSKRRDKVAYNRTYMAQLEEYNPVVAGRELLEIVDYIRRCHGATCILGSDYLCGLERGERQALLERMPYLPYSVIVQSDFSEIRDDHMLGQTEFGDFAYPVIGLDAVLSDALVPENGHMFFVTKDKALFYDSSAVLRRREALEKQTAALEKELARLKDNEATYMADVEYLGEFIVDYYDKFVDNMAVISANREQTELLTGEDKALEEKQQADTALTGELTAAAAAQEARLEELAREEKTLEAIVDLEARMETVSAHLTQLGEEQRSLEVRLEQARLAVRKDSGLREEARQRMAFLEQKKAEQEKVWKDIYSSYFREDVGAEDEYVGSAGAAAGAGAADVGGASAADVNGVGGGDAAGAGAVDADGAGAVDAGGSAVAAGADGDDAAEGSGAAEVDAEEASAGDSTAAAPANASADEKPATVLDLGQPQTSDEIESAFCGLREAFEKEYTDLEDKKQLLESYTQSMERLLTLIDERAVSVSELEDMYASGRLTHCDQQILTQLKSDIASLTDKIREMTKTVEEARANKNRLFGSVENAISAVREKYGSFEEVDLKDRDYATFVNEQQNILARMKEKYASSVKEIERILREQKGVEDIRKDLERLMRVVRVNYNLTRDFYADDSHLRQRFDELSEQYEQLRRDEGRKKEEFEKNRDKLVDVLRELKAYELADEVRYHIELPEDEAQARRLVENVRETIHVIELEKERISQGMRDMVQIKESFESQCLQRCLDIRTELERLPKLSKITLDGQQVPMIQLRIPYIREEFQKQEMSAYIDAIVANADTYADFDDKLKYIRQKLSWKNLFSVIVTDMNAIRLNLYKRERIREQSRYLKYEEAVGSTGQSQGIYIQFLIAIINYISAINSGDADAAQTKKVIFIDNPFGAAKDIYIWEPIFELLATNNVQLIVPARGATPAISGKFDVNYVLGQKLIDGKQQTVVIDYHSNIHIEDVEYVKIDFEQEVFDFI